MNPLKNTLNLYLAGVNATPASSQCNFLSAGMGIALIFCVLWAYSHLTWQTHVTWHLKGTLYYKIPVSKKGNNKCFQSALETLPDSLSAGSWITIDVWCTVSAFPFQWRTIWLGHSPRISRVPHPTYPWHHKLPSPEHMITPHQHAPSYNLGGKPISKNGHRSFKFQTATVAV